MQREVLSFASYILFHGCSLCDPLLSCSRRPVGKRENHTNKFWILLTIKIFRNLCLLDFPKIHFPCFSQELFFSLPYESQKLPHGGLMHTRPPTSSSSSWLWSRQRGTQEARFRHGAQQWVPLRGLVSVSAGGTCTGHRPPSAGGPPPLTSVCSLELDFL